MENALFTLKETHGKIVLENHNLVLVTLKTDVIIGCAHAAEVVTPEELANVFCLRSDQESEQCKATRQVAERLQTLQDNINVNWECLKKEEATQLKALIMEFADVFAVWADEVGRTHGMEHQIDTKDVQPIRQPS